MTDFKHTGYGAVLRRRREEMGLSLDDMAASTRVRKTYLQALEEENLGALPGSAYAVGFLRIYARQLNLAVTPLLASLAGAAPAENGEVVPAATPIRERGLKQAGKKRRGGRFIILLAMLLLAAGAYLYLRQVPAPERPLTPAVTKPALLPPTLAPPVPQPVAAPPAVGQAPEGQPAIVPVELPVIPLDGAVVRMLPVSSGSLKVSLDNQEVREYQLQADQSLNWKVSASLAIELSAPGLARVWVDQQELAVADYQAYVLQSVPRQERHP